MDPAQIFQWLTEQQKQQQQHQVQLLQQLATQGQEQQRQLVMEITQQQERWVQHGIGRGASVGPLGDGSKGPVAPPPSCLYS